MTSYVCKSSQSSLVKGFIPDNSTRLNYARAREGRRCSDKRLLELVTKALYALEDPAAGFVFDDFDLRYRERERKREADAARHYYRDKLSFETKYADDCEKSGAEPAWVSDGGRGAAAVRRGAGADLAEKRRKKRLRAALAKARRVSPALAKTLGLIIKNGRNRKESIWTLAKTR